MTSLGERPHSPTDCHRNGLPHLGPCRNNDMPTFTCPDCLISSQHSGDVKNSYCFRCHAFKYESHMPPRCMEPRCPDFGSYDFGEGTCPAEHATPPARRT